MSQRILADPEFTAGLGGRDDRVLGAAVGLDIQAVRAHDTLRRRG
jgi:hypothetical protein